jgi:hypothetical protein
MCVSGTWSGPHRRPQGGTGVRNRGTRDNCGSRACVANCVVGVGLFQGLEFILQSSGWELVKHAGIGWSRLRNCVRLLRRSRVCRVHLGEDPELNARTVLDFALKM